MCTIYTTPSNGGTNDISYKYPGYLYSVFLGGRSGHFTSGAEAGSPSTICHTEATVSNMMAITMHQHEGSLNRHVQSLTKVTYIPS